MNADLFKHHARVEFSTLATAYDMQFIDLPLGQLAIVGRGYGIIVADDFEALSLEYITYSQSSDQVVSFPLRSHDKFFRVVDGEQSRRIDNPQGLEEIIVSEMRLFAFRLQHNCPDVLTGDESWIARKRDKEPRLWNGTPLRAENEAAIRLAAPRFCAS